MNKVILIGRPSRDPETKVTGEGTGMSVSRFTLAVDRKINKDHATEGQQTADFISCVAFGKNAEFVEKYLRKGLKIAVAGRLQTGSYTNKDGIKVYTTDVVVDEIEFCEKKQVSGNNTEET